MIAPGLATPLGGHRSGHISGCGLNAWGWGAAIPPRAVYNTLVKPPAPMGPSSGSGPRSFFHHFTP
jgi:hypothetical protein